MPFPAYEEVKSVFVDHAPLQMGDNYLFEALAPYGRVISVQHLTVVVFRPSKQALEWCQCRSIHLYRRN